ncbi:hypothetical protein TanjilG_32109 [Lupinus angustifolius]|uniref:Uncharacterized protein n=1 Tax=Lupinus angustifolius TaxID=3871 RepID=A0A1J7HK07_LUPAN|nr:PREDICTED: uncharacterized protein LOC109346141 isoform X2 [Lupinus angustifolius]OIW13128.1 hypothetical protein TanjilG_32109 [Lupinus angustifolius]
MDRFHSQNSEVEDEFQSTLHSAPSFAIYNNPLENDDTDPEQVLKKTTSAIIGSNSNSGGGAEFSFGLKIMDLIEENDVELEPHSSPPMYLAVSTEVGIDGTGFDDVVGSHELVSDDIVIPNLHEGEDLGEYYKKIVDEYPFHPLVLKKYAQLLLSRGDIQGAEEYFLRVTLVDPNDGEILMQYAKLVWEQHHDKDKAMEYFELAAQAAPHDSNVLAAYTSFLWEIGDDENEGEKHETQNEKEEQKNEHALPSKEERRTVRPFSLLADGKDIDTSSFSEDDFKKMVDENPNNPLFLKKYAQFLFQSKGDLQAAHDYYSRAIIADPIDGEMISEYARLEWKLHCDHEKASNLFEQAVQATPGNSNILAAYACFLWETEDEES